MGRAGFEHTPLTTPKTPIPENTRTESGTVDGETQPKQSSEQPSEPANDITALADLLTALPASDRTSIIADLPQKQRLAVAKLIAARITEDHTNG